MDTWEAVRWPLGTGLGLEWALHTAWSLPASQQPYRHAAAQDIWPKWEAALAESSPLCWPLGLSAYLDGGTVMWQQLWCWCRLGGVA